MKRRLFVAIQLPGRFKKQILEYPQNDKKIREFRWTESENLHITVYFIGGIEEEAVPQIQQQLENLFLETKSFDIEFEDIIYGPPGRSPRMIWAVFKDRGEYKNLADKVYESLKNVVDEDNRAKEAIIHITLARFKDPSISKDPLHNNFSLRNCRISSGARSDDEAYMANIRRGGATKPQPKSCNCLPMGDLPQGDSRKGYYAAGLKAVRLRPIDIRDKVINVSSCDLIESKLSPKGPSYNIIKRFSFKSL